METGIRVLYGAIETQKSEKKERKDVKKVVRGAIRRSFQTLQAIKKSDKNEKEVISFKKEGLRTERLENNGAHKT